ncbi:MAG: hypothetical protein H7A20_01045 [Rhodanobacteraceae bacterium]|nr:hypothetical protein [Rhodanobacteraceae bacterium]HPF73929.1 hypothetical protein [Xanthomonadaceae bacterium]HRY00305.1 hypothetical protein [Xanthomonadaceae bacterium]
MQPPDRYNNAGREPVEIADALQRAPLEAPPQSVWPQLQVELSRSEQHLQARSARRHRHWLAMAATLLLAAAIPAFWLDQSSDTSNQQPVTASGDQPTATSTTTPSPDANELALLRQESAALEAWLATASDDTVISATGDGLREALTGRVQYVDALITDPQTSPNTQLPLWRERVLLLRRLASIESSEQLLAVSGDADDSQLVMAF